MNLWIPVPPHHLPLPQHRLYLRQSSVLLRFLRHTHKPLVPRCQILRSINRPAWTFSSSLRAISHGVSSHQLLSLALLRSHPNINEISSVSMNVGAPSWIFKTESKIFAGNTLCNSSVRIPLHLSFAVLFPWVHFTTLVILYLFNHSLPLSNRRFPTFLSPGQTPFLDTPRIPHYALVLTPSLRSPMLSFNYPRRLLLITVRR